ncbi:MAG: PD-(D/E)XK nuclease family protein [Comamonadaceae bacterium]|nr:MAG: PD-(D/E)XK nuclease family protein [Comamonadaceae bacterium]
MTVIAKNDDVARSWRAVFERVRAHADATGAHMARTVVLVPYAQLMAEGRRQWAQHFPDGFMPRIETSRNWARQLGAPEPAGEDLALDIARDAITARALLDRAGLTDQREVLATALLEMAAQLAAAVAAVPPLARSAWADAARALLPASGDVAALRLESAAARIALEWVLASRHATDVLFDEGVRPSVDALVVLQGFQPDALARSLAAHWGVRALELDLFDDAAVVRTAPAATVSLHAAEDAEDEAQRAAACVLQHLDAGHTPVALAATDRALTRRVTALLDGVGVPVHDENGWTLSTTRAAAQLMAMLRAGAWNASTDAVLECLKQMPAVDAMGLRALEKWLRRTGLAQWSAVAAIDLSRDASLEAVAALIELAQAWREPMRAARPLAEWLAALRSTLQQTQLWEALQADAAGARVLAELRLPEGLDADLEALDGAGRRMSLADFTRWVDDVLEAGRYRPDHLAEAAVVVLPLSQLLARPFCALVLPGCDEKRLQAAPEPPGPWTQAQREGLGLPTRDVLESAQRAAWHGALRIPRVDVLWRVGDEGGEPLLASPLVLALQLDGHAAPGADGRESRTVAAAPVSRPAPIGSQLPVARLSSTAYSDLRHCPYRFFALRQLELQESDELGAEVDKRDFGTWLHAVLQHFHEALANDPTQDGAARAALMDEAAASATRAQRLDAGEFLPFASGWPALRKGYLQWLARHEAEGASFRRAEVRATQPLGTVQLVGMLDRIDAVHPAGGGEPVSLVIDYKTESDSVTRKRLGAGSEDTQLAFYAALLQDDHLRAAYVNVGERGETQSHEQEDVVALRDQLVEGILHDFERIAQGAPLPALGEGAVCEWCAVRGLCRKDSWS